MVRRPPFSRSPDAARLLEAVDGLTHAHMRLARREAASAGLSMPQFFILRRIRRTGPIPSTGWAEQSGIRASTASGLVDGLVRAGWARRAPDPSDRRRVLVDLSERGRARVDAIARARRRRVLDALEGLPPSELTRTARALEELAERLGRGLPSGRFAGPEPPHRPGARGPLHRPSTRPEAVRAG